MNTSFVIVAGVDGSVGGRRALEWAATQVQARGGAVRAVLAWTWDGIEGGPVTAASPQDQHRHAAEVLDREVAAVRELIGSGVPIVTELRQGRPADVLTAAAQTADALVLGSHGHSAVRHRVLGSVSEQCIRKATCPVVVLPAPAPATGYQSHASMAG